jgi:hypothetical protein
MADESLQQNLIPEAVAPVVTPMAPMEQVNPVTLPGAEIKVPATSLGWGPNPELDNLNKYTQDLHDKVNMPMAQTLVKATDPTATPDDHLAAAKIVKNISTSDEFRLADLLGAIGKRDYAGVVKAFSGGSDVTKEAYDSNGNQYRKIFNQRASASNPLGELRRYEAPDGKGGWRQLSSEEIQKIGPITTIEEVPLNQQPFFMANGIKAKDVATAQSAQNLREQRTASVAALASGTIRQAAQEQQDLTKKLLPDSVNPKTLALLAGANQIRSGSSKGAEAAQESLSSFEKGKGSNDSWEEFKKNNAGVAFGLRYEEGKGLTNGSGQRASTAEIQSLKNSISKNATSDASITADRDALLEKAQILANNGDIKNIDLYKRFINNQYIIAKAQNEIEAAGGIGIIQPNLPYQKGDSFSLAHTKAVLDETYADLAEKYAKTVFDVQRRYGPNVPAIGTVQNELSQDKEIGGRKRAALDSINRFLDENKDVLNKINKGGVNPQLLAQPGAQAVAPSVPTIEAPRASVTKIESKPEGSKPPSEKKTSSEKPKIDYNQFIPLTKKK